MLFFVSGGMLFDPMIMGRDPFPVIATVFIIVIGKSVTACLIVLAFRQPLATALMISASLAQIGEFSFILAGSVVTGDTQLARMMRRHPPMEARPGDGVPR